MTTSPTDFGAVFEGARTVMLSLITFFVCWIARMVFVMRDDVRDLNVDVRGRDGKNGMKSQLAALIDRVKLIEDRNLVIDAVADVEKGEYDDDERRHGLRTLRGLIRSEIASAQLREQS